jgi:hypothetical protein
VGICEGEEDEEAEGEIHFGRLEGNNELVEYVNTKWNMEGRFSPWR